MKKGHKKENRRHLRSWASNLHELSWRQPKEQPSGDETQFLGLFLCNHPETGETLEYYLNVEWVMGDGWVFDDEDNGVLFAWMPYPAMNPRAFRTC